MKTSDTNKPFTLYFKINDLPLTRNALADRKWKRHKERNKWHLLVSMKTGRKPKPNEPLTCADIELIRHSSRVPDFDGLVSSFKFVIDALVSQGFLQDDNLNVLPAPKYKWKKTKPRQGFIEVTLKDRNQN